MKKGVNLHLYLLLAVINTAVFIFLWHGAGPDGLDNLRLLDWGANFAPLTLTGEPWRLLTSAFLHGSWTHLLLNMYMLIVLGSVLERVVGSLRFASIYLLCALGGSLLSAFWHGYHEVHGFQTVFGVVAASAGIRPVVSVGASGALMGLASAAGVWALCQSSGTANAANEQNVRIRFSAIAQVIVINLMSGFVTSGIDQAAHVGGLIAGLLAGVVLYPYASMPSWLRGAVLPVVVGVAGSAAMVWAAQHGQSEDLLDWKTEVNAQRAQAVQERVAAAAKVAARQAAIKEAQTIAEIVKEDARTAPKPVSAEIAAGTVVKKLGNQPDAMVVGASGKYLYVTDNGANTLNVIDIEKHEVVKTIRGGAFDTRHDSCTDNYCRGVGATGVVVSPDERYAYVASLRADSLVRIDLQSGTVVDAVELGRFPRAVVASSSFDRLYVLNSVDDTVSVVSLSQWPKVIATIALSNPEERMVGPFGRSLTMWLSPDDQHLFTNTTAKNALLEFDTRTFQQVHEYPMDERFDRAIKTHTGVWLYGGGTLKWADASTLEVRETYPICGSNTRMIAASRDGSFLAVADPDGTTMRVVKVATRRSIGAWPIARGTYEAAFSKDGQTLFALGADYNTKGSGSVSILNKAKTMEVSSAQQQDEFLCPLSTGEDSAGTPDTSDN
ncbi:rhomboid family intramembrane serine protease [Paraburkholderia silviterrae]|uniref:Rhomboid family intramembrane serine protease n=1 Tax=Paraburkholderia silviterrae TaxID=2528715 RepID=A0A4R5M6N9_9BURK|nr:rhomboid family intramembrane serine protease [Paraburkholderia silviterrae]TDG21705.1 rhomboid family intramembrane serine protease [Paraburkholderia silviterrae]